MGALRQDPLHRIVNVHWPARKQWTFMYLLSTVSGFVNINDPDNPMFMTTPRTSYQIGFVTIEAANEPPVPPPPARTSFEGDTPGFVTAGTPPPDPMEPAPPGDDGPFVRGVDGGAYTVSVTTVYKDAFTGAETPGPDGSLNYGGTSVSSLASPGIAWTPSTFEEDMSIAGNSAQSGWIFYSPNFALQHFNP